MDNENVGTIRLSNGFTVDWNRREHSGTWDIVLILRDGARYQESAILHPEKSN